MKKIKNFKYSDSGMPGDTGASGLFNMLTKRYSTVKFLRNTPGRQGSPQPISTGSYDMSGHDSGDLKREIGAPILISKTRIDTDTTDCAIPIEKFVYNVPGDEPQQQLPTTVAELTETPPTTVVDDIKFTFHTPADDAVTPSQPKNLNHSASPISEYETPKLMGGGGSNILMAVLQKNRSKSASNLHKSEMTVFLHKAPSLELELNNNTPLSSRDNGTYDVPRQLHYKEVNAVAAPPVTRASLSSSSTLSSVNNVSADSLSDFSHSKDSLNKPKSQLRTTGQFSRDSLQPPSSHKRHGLHPDDSSGVDDFDLKSASFQSLDARNLFLSIEELNEITRQINEAEDFGVDAATEVDLEYCEHRDRLRPDQRRITLLRNKHTGPLYFDRKKEKLSNAWTGLKHWIGEERGKLKDVIHKHAAAQRVGGSHSGADTSMVRNQEFFDRVKRRRGQPELRVSMAASDDPSHASSTYASDGRNEDYGSDDDERRNYSAASNGRIAAAADDSGDEVFRSRTQSRVNGSADREAASGTAGSAGFSVPSLVRKGNKTVATSANGRVGEQWEGQNGFEELRRYVKQGGDFGKDLVAILQERVDAEQLYAKSLSKMASKLNKACREIPGSFADAWRGVATEMESRGEVHRLFSHSMVEEIVKPLKAILENQHKTRKAIEGAVDKSARILSEWRTSEAKAKKSSHAAARENEKLQDAMLDVRIQRSPSVAMLHAHVNHKTPDKETKSAEKDCVKLDNKRRKAEESVKRADVEYYTLCIRAERARVEWEMSVLRGSTILQNHENHRLTSLKAYLTDYLKFSNQMNPSMNQIVERLAPHVNACNVQKDLSVVKNIRRASEGPSEQLLPDFYCEHTTLAMNRERRKHALVKLLQLVRTDLDRERKSRNGLKELSQSMNAPDNQNITDKLYHIRSMLTYLEGARFKLQSALLELDHKPRGSHPLAPHIQITRDRTGLQQSILKVPLWLRNGDETDRLNQEFTDAADLHMLEQLDHADSGCVDGRNEVLIKHFDRNFSRSQSNIEFNANEDVVGSIVGSEVLMGKDIVVLSAGDSGGGASSSSNASSTNGEKRRGQPVSPVFDRGIADGGSNQPDSDFDEFSSQDEDDEVNGGGGGGKKLAAVRRLSAAPPAVISRCRALYSYVPKLYDELELHPGDLIDVHEKQEDGWWLGALKTKIGIFPATYVEVVD